MAAQLWCVVPAGGRGVRVGAPLPKQYLPLAGQPLLCWALQALAAMAPEAILLVVAPDDTQAARLPNLPAAVTILPEGGASRAESVLAGLRALTGRAAPDDWVMVHDAVRPCLAPEQVTHLLQQIAQHPDGGLLAEPVEAAVKESGAPGVAGAEAVRTLERERLWLAQTPQVFRHGVLMQALTQALAAGVRLPDEAAAIEHAGGRPLLVPGARANLKVTRPDDLPLAEFWLARGRQLRESETS